jgi:hypothetical protein
MLTEGSEHPQRDSNEGAVSCFLDLPQLIQQPLAGLARHALAGP